MSFGQSGGSATGVAFRAGRTLRKHPLAIAVSGLIVVALVIWLINGSNRPERNPGKSFSAFVPRFLRHYQTLKNEDLRAWAEELAHKDGRSNSGGYWQLEFGTPHDIDVERTNSEMRPFIGIFTTDVVHRYTGGVNSGSSIETFRFTIADGEWACIEHRTTTTLSLGGMRPTHYAPTVSDGTDEVTKKAAKLAQD